MSFTQCELQHVTAFTKKIMAVLAFWLQSQRSHYELLTLQRKEFFD